MCVYCCSLGEHHSNVRVFLDRIFVLYGVFFFWEGDEGKRIIYDFYGCLIRVRFKNVHITHNIGRERESKQRKETQNKRTVALFVLRGSFSSLSANVNKLLDLDRL